MEFTVGSLFSGVGGLDLAAHWAGFETKWFVEKEPFCQKVLAKHWPNIPIHSDIFECHDLEHVSLLHGGFPCQPFSVAGNRKGADDERYLLPEMLRIISEVKPYAVLFENVPGFPSLSDGAEFKYLLRALAEMGFDAEWGHLRASDSGAPHQRERWFLVAYTDSRNGNGWAESRIRRSDRIAMGSIELADTAGIRREHDRTGSQQDRFQQGRASKLARRNQTQLGNANNTGLQGRSIARNLRSRRSHGKQFITRPGESDNRGSTQSSVCRDSHGLPSGMDFIGWPARPGEDQHAYEPSRVTSAKTPDRAARLKALGNAVVPQVAFPLFVAIHEWLTAQDAERVA